MTAPARERSPLARGVLVFALAALVCLPRLASAAAPPAGETLGFVISAWDYGFPREGRPPACAVNQTEAEYYKVDMRRFRADVNKLGWVAASEKHFPPDACRDPTVQPDPGFRTFDGDLPVDGLDLDGVDSKKSDGSSCAHDDLPGTDGARGVDNQHWRLVGCTRGFQPFFTEIRESRVGRQRQGGILIAEEDYPILVEVSGVDDRKNDDDVRVRIFSSAGPITLDANNDVVPYVSLGVYPDPKYWGPPVRGKIENGVLTTDPVDLKLRFKQQVLDGELYYRDARLRARINDAGRLEGVLGFYWDTDSFYRIHNDHHIGDVHTGRLLSLARGYMCAGMYHALQRLADGHLDPATGKCTAISSALRFQATPVFVITDPR